MTLQPEFLYNRCYSDYGFVTRLLFDRHHCGNDNVRPAIRQCTPRRSSVLGSRQRHRRQRVGSSVLTMSKRLMKKVYFDPSRVGSHARAAENSRAMVVGTGRLQLTQTSETTFQETTRHRGRYESTVAGRSRRRYDLSPHNDRRLFETSQMRSYA